jgi:hypothetical protein
VKESASQFQNFHVNFHQFYARLSQALFVNVEIKEHTYSLNKPKKFKQCCLPARKLMAAVFWYSKGVLIVEFMQQGITITSEVYRKKLKSLCHAIQNKRCGILTSVVVLICDNVRLHTAART